MASAFLFPGQGSQGVGMLAEFAGDDTLRATFDSASSVLGYDLWELIQNGPRDKLDVTERTQPAMLTAGVTMWRLWRDRGGPEPVAMAGHSLGEYTALVCAGALEFEAAVGLVQHRGRLMQEAVPAGSGAMAAVLGLDDAGVEAVCAECSTPEGVVEAVNYNAPGQVVIAGHAAAVGRAIGALRARGARRAIELPVSVPSHSSLMQPAAERLVGLLAETSLSRPAIRVYTVGLREHGDPDDIRVALGRQLYSPVRWSDTIRHMIEHDRVDTLIECGPGKVLTGLNRRIDRDPTALAIYDRESLASALASVDATSGGAS